MFWCTAGLCYQLACWGASVSSFFHACPLSIHPHEKGTGKPSCKNCQWKNRMASKLSQGVWLGQYSQEILDAPLGQANKFLKNLNRTKQEYLLDQFTQCKTAMAQRFIQVYSYWRELPWRLCSIALCLFYMGDDEEMAKEYTNASKRFALDCLDKWKELQSTSTGERGGYKMFLMTKFFLDPAYPNGLAQYVYYWGHSTDTTMPPALSQVLMQYASSLTSMQMLEAEHHYLSQRVSFGRASLPASTCAYLRRRANPDVHQQVFKDNIERFIGCLSELVASKWNNRTETCDVKTRAWFQLFIGILLVFPEHWGR